MPVVGLDCVHLGFGIGSKDCPETTWVCVSAMESDGSRKSTEVSRMFQAWKVRQLFLSWRGEID